MKARVKDLRKLLDLLCEEFGQPVTMTGMEVISQKLEFSTNYLYKNIHFKISKLADGNEVGVNDRNVGILCQSLGFKSYTDFRKSLDRSNQDSLQNLVGSYYSYVRMNSRATTELLRSPVKISQTDQNFYWELKGKDTTYKGRIEYHHGCMFILMNSEAGKVFHHIYEIGQGKRPMVLQGIFSAVSSAFDPIGGRTVLVRMDKDFKDLANEKVKLPDLKKSGEYACRELAIYFKDYDQNNLSTRKSTTFDKSDLL